MSVPRLESLIRENIDTDQRVARELRGGLCLVFYPPDGLLRRMVATRKGVAPSDVELDVITRSLKSAVAGWESATVGRFERVAPNNGWQAAEIYVYTGKGD